MKSTCKDCTNRHVGCHSRCETYLNAKAEWDKHKQDVNEARNAALLADTLALHRGKRRNESKLKRQRSGLKN